MAQQRIWRGTDGDLFRFTTTDLRELHLAIMSAFEEASVLAPALNLDQVRVALDASGWDEPLDDDALIRALGSLVGWGLLEATQDHGAQYATPEEFERKNLQWSLTRRGEAAIGGVLHALESLRRAIGLQPAVLDAIGDALADIASLLGASGDDVAPRIHLRLADVESYLSSLVHNVRQFNGHLQRLLRDDATDDAVFLDLKRRTITYLEEYVEGVERAKRRLALAIGRVESLGLPTLFDRALTGANLAPVGGVEPGPDWIAERARRWQALHVWFVGADGEPARLDGLIEIARTAILQLLRVLERRWESRRRSASVANDFRRLATLFAEAPGDAEAHGLFNAAFGLWPARHAHILSADGEAQTPSVSWASATPAEVAPSLRTTGTLANRGRVRPIGDPTGLRAARQAAQARALERHSQLRATLVTSGLVPLSSFGTLDSSAFGELLALLSVALDAPASSDGVRRATSADGRVEIELVDPGDGRTAVLEVDHGTLHAPDFRVSIQLTAPAGTTPAVTSQAEAARA